MRNLKRALSLALASVMLLGMMVVGSSAKGIDDFTDKAEIVNQDAVAVTLCHRHVRGLRGRVLRPRERSHPRRDGGHHLHHAVWCRCERQPVRGDQRVHRRPRLGAGAM